MREREAHRPAVSSPSDVITMLKGLKQQQQQQQHENKEQVSPKRFETL